MEMLDRVRAALGLGSEQAWRLAGSALVIVAWIALVRVARRILARTIDDAASRFYMGRVTGYLVGAVGTLVLLRIWVQSLAGLATYLGLVSAGVAIALQDPLTNVAGWLFIMIRRPFKVGDRIQVGAQIGDVVDIRPLRFVMLEIGNWVGADQSTGRVLHVPNGLVFKNAVANYDEAFGYIWNELAVTVTFESDWRKAKQTLEAIVGEEAGELDAKVRKRIDAAAESMHMKFTKLTPVVWTSVADHGVCLTMRYLCKPRERRSSASGIWEKILAAFAELPDVDFAYPTMRRYDNVTEGKPGARAEPPSPGP